MRARPEFALTAVQEGTSKGRSLIESITRGKSNEAAIFAATGVLSAALLELRWRLGDEIFETWLASIVDLKPQSRRPS